MNIRIVTASAGTGKTTHLSDLLRQAVSSGAARAEAIVATTFTKQAAAELMNRTRSELLRTGQSRAAEALMTARLGTVNSICGGLVADFALELGLSPELRVLDESAAELELVRALATVVDAPTSELLDRYKDRFDREFDWQYEVRRIIETARANGLEASALADCARRSKDALDRCLGDVKGDEGAIDLRLRDTIVATRDGINPNVDRTATTSKYLTLLDESCRHLEQNRLRWGNWARLCSTTPAVKSATHAAPVQAAAATHLGHPRLRREMHELIDRLFDVAASGMQAYQAHKEDLGLLDYVDQEVLALRLLRRADVREALAGKIDLVLVDEFQDTSPLQLAIFLELSLVASQSVWVGDPKQAIYGFRGTDPKLMDAAIESLTNPRDPDLVASAVDRVTGRRPVETLSRSYRSRPSLIGTTNEIFARAFASQGMPEARTRVESALTIDPPELGPALSHWQLAGKNQTDRAQALAGGVVALRAAGASVRDRRTGATRAASLADIAILCRTNKQCQDVAEALGQQGLPAVVARVGLLASAEGQVLTAGLRLWVDPHDRLAAAVLHRIVECPEDPSRFVTEALADPDIGALFQSPCVDAIVQARNGHPDTDLVGAIDQVLQASDLRQLCAEWGDSAQRTANLDALRAHAGAYRDERLASRDTPTVVGFLAYLQEMLGDWGWNAPRTDRCALMSGQEAITVSTWHAAKGLEWPIVALYGLETLRDPLVYGVHVMNDRADFDLDDPLGGRWVRFWPNPYTTSNQLGPVKTAYGNSQAYRDVAERSTREALRVLYVGWTRARDRLILAAETGKLLNGLLGILKEIDPALISEPPAPTVAAPQQVHVDWAGHTTAIEVCACAAQPPAPAPAVAGQVRVGRPAGATSYPPARLAPSAAPPRPCTVGAPAVLGPPMLFAGQADMDEVGNAVHGFLSTDDPALPLTSRTDLAAGLVRRHGLDALLSAAELVNMGDRLWLWARTQFPGGRICREWPITHLREDGTLVTGAVDLVIETADHVAIIDHKSVITHAGLQEKAKSFAGQLGCYADAMAGLRPETTVSTWVHLPLAGIVVDVTPTVETAQ